VGKGEVGKREKSWKTGVEGTNLPWLPGTLVIRGKKNQKKTKKATQQGNDRGEMTNEKGGILKNATRGLPADH